MVRDGVSSAERVGMRGEMVLRRVCDVYDGSMTAFGGLDKRMDRGKVTAFKRGVFDASVFTLTSTYIQYDCLTVQLSVLPLIVSCSCWPLGWPVGLYPFSIAECHV